jgi:molybdopterin synthase sulfur carrier subunit
VAARISVLYFAGLRDAIGIAEETIELPGRVRTVGELCDHLAERHRGYAERRASVRVARNEAFAGDADRLDDGDVIALIPPVAGG